MEAVGLNIESAGNDVDPAGPDVSSISFESSVGKGIREFKRNLSDTQEAIFSHPDGRPRASRQPDDPTVPAPTQGEPKRLSE